MKAVGGEGIVFPALIDDANVAMRRGIAVGDHAIEFADLKRSWIPFIFKTESKLPRLSASFFHGASRKGSLSLNSFLPIPWALIPMDFGQANSAVNKADPGNTLSLRQFPLP